MQNVELLAPAGNLDILKSAILSGADAVYIGGKNFGARAYAGNFSHDEIIEAVNFAHHYGVRIYVTMNTLLNEFEIESAMKEVDFLYKAKVDALIIQDLGLYYRIINEYRDMEIHASTQMHIHNLSGVETCKRLGFKRVVLARESSLNLIKEATKKGIEIEVFVHGAICVSYSGQCLMSAKMKNRSGNKGICAQCCRLPYDLVDKNDTKVDCKDKYLLSPKDMNLLKHVPSLINAGVTSFKIEGRMKKKAYVCLVTGLYRQAIDAFYHNEKFIYTDKMDRDLHALFQRDFTDEYLLDVDNKSFFASNRPNHNGISIGKVVDVNKSYVSIKLSDDLNQFDGIRFINKFDDGCIVNYLYRDGLLVNSAKCGDIVNIKNKTKAQIGDEVIKTSDYFLENSFENLKPIQRLDIELKVYAKAGSKLRIDVKYKDVIFSVYSDIELSKALNIASNNEDILKQLNKLKDTPYYISSIEYEIDKVFIPNKVLNKARRDFVEKLDEFRDNSFKRALNTIDYDLVEPIKSKISNMSQRSNLIQYDNREYVLNNVINPKSEYIDGDCVVVSELGALLNDCEHKIAYYTLNVSNSYAYELLRKLGYEAIILSSELNKDQIDALFNRYVDRTNDKVKPFIFKKGNRILMYLKKDPTYQMNDNQELYLVNGFNKFKIIKDKLMSDTVEIIEENYSNEDSKDYGVFEILE